MDSIEQLETIIGIKTGLEDMAKGETEPVSQFIEEMQQKHGISS